MATLGSITRRAFLLGSVAVAGGVAFGVYQYRKPYPNPLTGSEAGAVLNPYLIIDQRGVTIITPRAEMGQGVHSTLAALLAEELDVRWQDVRAEHGPVSSAYYNQAVIVGTAPFAAFDTSRAAQLTRDVMGVASKFLGMQMTGGSSSSVDAFDKMRVADVGIALDPRNLEAQMSSAIIYGLSAAMIGEITFADGAVVQSNFHDYDALRMRQVPPIEVRILENGATLSGAGEPGTPPSLPALANAICALTGQRIRSLPLNKQVQFS